MKAAFMKDRSDIALRDIRLRGMGSDEVRLRVDACGVCGTDVTTALSGEADYQPFGHEVAGAVLDVGPGVTRVKPGERVVLDSRSACGECDNCKDARQDLCTDTLSFFDREYRGFAEEMLTPGISCVPYDGMPPEHACLAEPLGVAIDMHRLAQVEVGSHVLVSGLGPIGLMALRLARLSGAEKLYACDLSSAEARIEAALRFGADEIIEVDKTGISEYRFSRPPDRFMITSPPSTIPPMMDIAAVGAILSFVGIQYGEGAALTFDANEFHFKKLQLRGSFAAPALFTPFAVRLLRSGAVDAGALVTHVFELKDIAEAMRVAVQDRARAIKVVVVNR